MLHCFASPVRSCVLAFLCLMVLPVQAQSPRAMAAKPFASEISVREAHQLAAQNRIALIDIRRPSEWRQTGLAVGAVPLTMHQPFPRFLARMRELASNAGDKPLAIICAAGVRTARMQKILARSGLRVINVHPGMTGTWLERGWIQHGLPIRRYR